MNILKITSYYNENIKLLYHYCGIINSIGITNKTETEYSEKGLKFNITFLKWDNIILTGNF